MVIPILLLLLQHGAEIHPLHPLVSEEPAWEHQLTFTTNNGNGTSTTTKMKTLSVASFTRTLLNGFLIGIDSLPIMRSERTVYVAFTKVVSVFSHVSLLMKAPRERAFLCLLLQLRRRRRRRRRAAHVSDVSVSSGLHVYPLLLRRRKQYVFGCRSAQPRLLGESAVT